MPKFAVYEIWTRHRVIEADSVSDALDKADPHFRAPVPGLGLCNWHAVPVDEGTASEGKAE